MWNECDFLNVLKFEQKKNKKYFFPPAEYEYTKLFLFLPPWHESSYSNVRAASVI